VLYDHLRTYLEKWFTELRSYALIISAIKSARGADEEFLGCTYMHASCWVNWINRREVCVCVMVIEVRRKLVLELNTVNLTYGVWKVMRISPADPYYLCCVLYQWSLKCQPRQPSTIMWIRVWVRGSRDGRATAWAEFGLGAAPWNQGNIIIIRDFSLVWHI
jgi:hypothetical protein